MRLLRDQLLFHERFDSFFTILALFCAVQFAVQTQLEAKEWLKQAFRKSWELLSGNKTKNPANPLFQRVCGVLFFALAEN